MRQLASYSFELRRINSGSLPSGEDVLHSVEAWIRSKGRISEDGQSVLLSGKRVANIERHKTETSQGWHAEISLKEPREDGWFRTAVSVAEDGAEVAVTVGLSVATSSFRPTYVDVRCPNIVRELLASPSPWAYQGTSVSSSPLALIGREGGDTFLDIIWNPKRTIPVVAISEDFGSVLDAQIATQVAGDLAGLATVVTLDPEASRQISFVRGKEWSCYGGAVRIFWPNLIGSPPFRHPLWTAKRLSEGVTDSDAAGDRIRKVLRRRVLSQSPFAVTEPTLFTRVKRVAREDELAALKAKGASEGIDYKALAEEYFEAAAKAIGEIEKKDQEIEDLKAERRSLQEALGWNTEMDEDVPPDTETPPQTVADAVKAAREKFSSELLFGEEVDAGVDTLAPDAGSPDKILTYLRVLAEFTSAKKAGSLGTTTIKWLAERGVSASVESDTVKKSATERQARTWDYGNGKKAFFDLHLKPSDATSPDRCVRIYFEYDDVREKTIVGWVGRHP